MREITGIVVLLIGIICYGQTGSLQIELGNNYKDAEFEYKLFISDSLVDSKINNSWQVVFDSLKTAKYRLVVDGVEVESDMPTTYENIQVYSDSITSMFISVWEYSVCCASCDSGYTNRFESVINLLYSPLPTQESPFIKNSFEIDIGGGAWLGLHKNFDLGGTFGFYYNATPIDSSFRPQNIQHLEKQQYSNSGLKFDVMGRIAFFNLNEWFNGAVIDVGASYKVPLYFRYVTKSEGIRIAQRKMHNFKDVNAFIKVGFTPVTVMLNYRLFDIVKNDYPQLPKWSAGLSFIILSD